MLGRTPDAIKMFHLLDSMKWPVVGPVAGSIYDQDPILMDKFAQIFAARNKHQAEEQRKREVEQARKSKGGGRVAGRRH